MGLPCCFVRLSGCPFRCTYCDTAYAADSGGESLSIPDILGRLAVFPCRLAEVTGGEPLAQPETPELLGALLDAGFSTLLETSGHLPLDCVPAATRIVMDIKTPGSGRPGFHPGTLDRLGPGDSIKFVICGRRDHDWAVARVRELDLAGRVPVYFSPAWGRVRPEDLARWILESGLPVRLHLPLHKIVWGDQRGV